MLWGLLVIVQRSSRLETEVCPDMRAQGKHLTKFPINMKVEDLVVYVIRQNFGVDVTAIFEIIPQVLTTPKGNCNAYHTATFKCSSESPLWAQRRLQGETQETQFRPPSFVLPLLHAPDHTPSPVTALNPATFVRWSLQPQDLARKLKWKLISV